MIEEANQELISSVAIFVNAATNDIEESVGDDVASVLTHQSSSQSYFVSSLVVSGSKRGQDTVSLLNQTVYVLGIDRDTPLSAPPIYPRNKY
eukprot:1288834-Ditylum_brightwellii.AAC.1